jgi:hypothetical protein
MSKPATRSKKKGLPEPTPEQLALLRRLKEIVASTGGEVREEKLVREVGYTVRSGPCILEGRDLLLLDSTTPIEERIETLLEYLCDRDLDGIYVEPRLRQLIGERAAPAAAPEPPERA